jgi:hypothetical protein
MSAVANRLLDDGSFILARPARTDGSGTANQQRQAPRSA